MEEPFSCIPLCRASPSSESFTSHCIPHFQPSPSHSSHFAISSHSLSLGYPSSTNLLHPSFAGIGSEIASISDHDIHLLQCTYFHTQQLDYHPNTLSTNQHASTSSSAFQAWSKCGTIAGSIRCNISEGQQLLKRCFFQLLPRMITAPSTSMSPRRAQDGQAYLRMMAERNRRKKQDECFKQLKSLLPGSIKRDKVSILEGAINYMAYLSARMQDLEKESEKLDSILEAKNSLLSLEKPVNSTNESCPLAYFVKVTEDDYPEGSIFRVQIRAQLNHLDFHAALFKTLAYLNEIHLQVLWSQAESECSTSCSIILLTLKEGMSLMVKCDDIQKAVENFISCEDANSFGSVCTLG